MRITKILKDTKCFLQMKRIGQIQKINEKEGKCQVIYQPGYGRIWLNDMKKGYDNLVERFGVDNITISKPAFGYYYPYEN